MKSTLLAPVPFVLMLLHPFGNAFAGDIVIKSRYQDVNLNKIERIYSGVQVSENRSESSSSNPLIERSILIAKLARGFKTTLEKLENTACNDQSKLPEGERNLIANDLRREILRLEDESIEKKFSNQQIKEAFALGRKLVTNIKEINKSCVSEQQQQQGNRGQQQQVNYGQQQQPSQQQQDPGQQQQVNYGQQQQPQQQQQQQQQMNVTGGGAQTAENFNLAINSGKIPYSQNFTTEGFMSDFDLSLDAGACTEILCIKPDYKIDHINKKLFVQLGMSTKITKADFKRKPLNLSMVIDVSGSMMATDGTDKTRLEWAKLAALETLKKMNIEDTISIVLFDDKETVLLDPIAVENKKLIQDKILSIKDGGSTNLEAGLRKGYNLVSENIRPGYENRVILFSDAGLNTGSTSDAELVRLVTEFAAEEIGLTAIGLGENFNQTFIHGITLSKGGNYVFVQSGAGLENYFTQFDFLVTPIAYNFKSELALEGLEAKLVEVYGMPKKDGAGVLDLLDIRTLFLTSSDKGGAILLEYDLK